MTKEFDAHNSVITPEGVFVIGTYDESGKPNAMTAAWGIQSDFGEITIYMSRHKTTDNIEKTGEFTVAFGTVDTVTLCDYFGIESGNNVDKIEKAGCTVKKAPNVNAPIIEGFPLVLECKCRSWDRSTGILVCEIVAQQVDESILTDGHVDLGKMRPIIYDTGMQTYRVIGEVVAKAYSEGLKIKKSGDGKWDN